MLFVVMLKRLKSIILMKRWLRIYLRRLKLQRNFRLDFAAFNQMEDSRFEVKWAERYPCLYDSTSKSAFDRHYVYHTAWASEILAKRLPRKHIDIASDLRFSSLISAFIPVDFYDHRPVDLHLSGFNSYQADLTNLSFADRSVSSLSCMHVIEHIGLGRYGDNLDPEGDLKAASELKRVLAHNGELLFAAPVGMSRIMFNAHRIYSYKMILNMFSGLSLLEFSLIPDSDKTGGLIRNASPSLVAEQKYACGCFHFKKVS